MVSPTDATLLTGRCPRQWYNHFHCRGTPSLWSRGRNWDGKESHMKGIWAATSQPLSVNSGSLQGQGLLAPFALHLSSLLTMTNDLGLSNAFHRLQRFKIIYPCCFMILGCRLGGLIKLGLSCQVSLVFLCSVMILPVLIRSHFSWWFQWRFAKHKLCTRRFLRFSQIKWRNAGERCPRFQPPVTINADVQVSTENVLATTPGTATA